MSANSGPADFRRRFIASNEDEQIKMLVRIGYAFSMEGRSTYEAGTEGVLEPAKLRWVNEAEHRVFAHLRDLLSGTANRHPDEVIADILIEHFERMGGVSEPHPESDS